MNRSISAHFDGSQWASYLQHFDEGLTPSGGLLKASEESFEFTVLQQGSDQAITLNLEQVVQATKEILAECESQPNAEPIKRAIVAGLEHLDGRVKELVDKQKLRGKSSHSEAMEFYEQKAALIEELDVTPESKARKLILELCSRLDLKETDVDRVREIVRENRNLLFKLTEYGESFFDLAGSRCSQALLLPLIREVLQEIQKLDPSSQEKFKKVLFQSNAPQITFFELLTKEKDGNRLFDSLMQIVTDDELNGDKNRMRQVISFAYSVKRYDYIFVNNEELPSQVALQASVCMKTTKLMLGSQSISEGFAVKARAKYMSWLRLRQTSSTTLAMGNVKSPESLRWNKANQLKGEYAKEDRGSSSPFTKEKIKMLHHILTKGEPDVLHPGEFRKKEIVRTSGGWTSLYCPPEYLPANIDHFMEWMNKGLQQCEEGTLNPVIFGSRLYQRFVSLHPFENGNGRIARLLMDYVLERFELPPPVLGNDIFVCLFPLDSKKSSQEKFLKNVVNGIYASHKLLIYVRIPLHE